MTEVEKVKKHVLCVMILNSFIFIAYFYQVSNINKDTIHMYELTVSLTFSCVFLAYQRIISDNE